MMASVCEFLGETVQSSEHFEKAVALHDPGQHLYYSANFGLDPGMIARALSIRPLWCLGHADRSLHRLRETLLLARSVNQPITLVFAIILAENIFMLRGQYDEALALGDEAIALCREYSLAQEMEWARCYQGLTFALMGRTGEGVAQLKDAIASMDRIKAGLQRASYLTLLAEALLAAGHYEEGLHAIDAGFIASERTLEGCYVAELHRVRGELLGRLERGDEARLSFTAAIDVARSQGAKAFELRAAMGLARSLKEAGRSTEAHACLRPVYASLTEGHDTLDLVQARDLLSTLEAAARG
jgi:tetratricopeptide (TPR) repeat protein